MCDNGFGYVKVENGFIVAVTGASNNPTEYKFDNPEWIAALKLQELVKERIKQLDESIQEQVKLITNIQNEMSYDITGVRHERFDEQMSLHQGIINIFKDQIDTLQSLLKQSEN